MPLSLIIPGKIARISAMGEYPLRTHHIEHVHGALTLGISRQAEIMVNAPRDDILYRTGIVAKNLAYVEANPSDENRRYLARWRDQQKAVEEKFKDVVGPDLPNPPSWNTYEQALFHKFEQALTIYTTSSRNNIRLVTRGKDLLCDCTFQGNHCFEDVALVEWRILMKLHTKLGKALSIESNHQEKFGIILHSLLLDFLQNLPNRTLMSILN